MNYSINIAKAYTMSDWRGLPAHRHMARVELEDTMSEDAAQLELVRLQTAYPWPSYHLTLTKRKVVTEVINVASTAPSAFLKDHQWSYPSIHPEEEPHVAP